MLTLNNLKWSFGSRKTSKRLWRWNWSWKWTFSWRWCKWQNARAWGWMPAWFEWGQTPLFRRLPKLRGFSNHIFKKEYNVVNISDLNKLVEKWITSIDFDVLLLNKIIRKKTLWVKLLGNWDLSSKVTIKVDRASNSAREIVEKAWGKIELITK